MDHEIISAILAEEQSADRALSDAREQAALLVSRAREQAARQKEQVAEAGRKQLGRAREDALRDGEQAAAYEAEMTARAVQALKEEAAPRIPEAVSAVVAYLRQQTPDTF